MKANQLEQIIEKLDLGDLVAIQDVHSNSKARLAVDEILQTGKVKVFFMECSSKATGQKSASYGDMLKTAVRDMLKNSLDYSSAVEHLQKGGYDFGKYDDAQPGLLELTARAISKNVLVVPADTNKEKIIARLQDKKVGGGPDGAWVGEQQLFQFNGLRERDLSTTRKIVKFFRTHDITTGRLMLWGENHFIGEDERKSLPTSLRENGINVRVVWNRLLE